MERYIIKEVVTSSYKKFQAIFEARTKTSLYVFDDKGKPIVYNGKQTVKIMLSNVYDALKNTTYTRRNTRTQLELGYRLVYIAEGKDYTINPDGSIDAIEVRGIQNDKVALRYSIESVTH